MRRAFAMIALLSVLLAGCASGLPGGVIYPSIDLDSTATEDIPVTVNFTFEGQPVTFTLKVDGSLYAGARNTPKSVLRIGDTRTSDWIAGYFPALVTDKHQDRFYSDLLSRFRTVRDARGLDSDQYAEMLVAYAQSLTYKTDPVNLEPKYPVETFVDGAGDCDDKSLLLAGLLSREGYDVAILMFEPEAHVALGIRSADVPYRDTGYAFTETTTPAFVGMVPDTFADGVTLRSEPRVFRVDGGTTVYTAGGQVKAILDGRERAIVEGNELVKQIDAADSALKQLEGTLTSTNQRLDHLNATGRTAEYNALVPEYNALVDRYNRDTDARNALAARHNILADLEETILGGLDDRPRVYAAVRAVFP